MLEGLIRINEDGSVSPLLAERWAVEPDGKRYAFTLRQGVRFHDGEAFDASDVKFSFERAKAEGSTNKAKKDLFDNIERIDAPGAHTVVLTRALPLHGFARCSGEIVAAQLTKVGIKAKIENVESARWFAGVFQGKFDLTLVSHLEPLDHKRLKGLWTRSPILVNDMAAVS